MPPPSNSPYQLIVEGLDDQHSILHLMLRHGFNWDDEAVVRPFMSLTNGITELLEAIPVAAKGPYERLGFVVDADVDLPNRWLQVRNRLVPLGLDVPASPDRDGVIIDGIRPGRRIGIWLMPDNQNPGTLEHFLAKLVPADDRTWAYAEETSTQARRLGAACAAKDATKSWIHTWLAWQEQPGLPFGRALRARVFRHDSDDALRFVAWFDRLFRGQ